MINVRGPYRTMSSLVYQALVVSLAVDISAPLMLRLFMVEVDRSSSCSGTGDRGNDHRGGVGTVSAKGGGTRLARHGGRGGGSSLERVTVNLTPRTSEALEQLIETTSDSKG